MKAGMVIVGVIFLLAGFLGVSYAEPEWIVFYKGEKNHFFYDKSSIERPEKQRVIVVQKIVEVKHIDDTIELFRTKFEIECKARTFKILSNTEFEEVTGRELTSDQIISANSKEGEILASKMSILRDNVCP